ncbi:MAG TPA: spore coat protein GerQ [Mollicutes bacterium]|jgi:spore germination protein Q|nr:spore coat protein GerQ [Mollicutes bacterium]
MSKMNNSYFGNNNFPGQPIFSGNEATPNQAAVNPAPPTPTGLPFEQSYIENILRLNKGKRVDVFMSFPDSTEWRNKVFTGIIEESGRDHIILSDPATGEWHLLLMIYVNYIEFHEKINYIV